MRNNKLISMLSVLFMSASLEAQTWIWYPGDYEIWLGNQMNNRRTERGAFFPPFWKTDSHYVVVEFSKEVDLKDSETINLKAEGKYNIKLDGKLQFGMPSELVIPKGKHKINIKVWNQSAPPSIYVKGNTIKSDSSWKVTYEDKEWIDESGKASDTSATVYMSAGSWNFNTPDSCPSEFRLNREAKQPVSVEYFDKGTLYDFGKETFGFLEFSSLSGKGNIHIYYGESIEEAKDTEYCETLDVLSVNGDKVTDISTNNVIESVGDVYTLENSKAFRYVYVVCDESVYMGKVSMQYEYLPETYRGSFRCDNDLLNRIWDVGAYTMHLTTREFFIDGIKRDRWVWSGDAIQSYLMNYYLFFDSETVKRTIWQLRGKDPVTSHINTIMDYTFYWFLSVHDYYMYTGDDTFVKQIYPRMNTLMEYVLGRTDADGMVQGMAGDWVFVDWADGFLDKKGQLAFEQILFCRSLELMAICAELYGSEEDKERYSGLASSLRKKIIPAFWDESKNALVHNRVDGDKSNSITRYANMFSVFYDYFTEEQETAIKNGVLLNDEVLKITTPYMRFYELEALCALGEHKQVMNEILDYWGGMLKQGATSFWEKYNPEDEGKLHLSMYGRPYGKSLCHAWGASPIYLLGKYYLGVKPVKPGYEEFEITPVLGGLKWMEGSVPVPNGDIHIYMDKKTVKIKAESGKGYVYVSSRKEPKSSYGRCEKIADGKYRLWIDTNNEVIIQY